MRRHRIRLAGTFERVVNRGCCVYCGDVARTSDHFVPVSVVAMLVSVAKVHGKFLVPACAECNAIAGDRVFRSVGAKRRYIQSRIAAKYRRILDMPHWSEAEIEELGYSLASSVRAGMAQKEWIIARLKWRNSDNSESAKLAAIRFRLGALGLGSARPNAARRRTASD